MRIVGIDFRDGILFVPEVLLAANAMKGGMEILRPLLAETGAEPIGKIVIGTVKGDMDDISSQTMEGLGASRRHRFSTHQPPPSPVPLFTIPRQVLRQGHVVGHHHPAEHDRVDQHDEGEAAEDADGHSDGDG